MLEIIYRIYEVADDETAEKNLQNNESFGWYSSTSKGQNIELLMDCMLCDSRESFKDTIRSMYGDIPFRYSKKLKPGDVYCIIIGEHCYNTEKYFNKIKFKCDYCGTEIETYYSKPIGFGDYEIKHQFFGIQDYAKKRFCSHKCKEAYAEEERRNLSPDDDTEFFIDREMFIDEGINGYIYKITKKSTGEFYVGQSMYVPVFRWGQHLKTDRFPIKDITDYKFEVLEIVPKSENILEREKYYIQKCQSENPEKSLNIQGLRKDIIDGQQEMDFDVYG